MTFKPLELQDCQNIAKAFERSASYCVTEESVFAMMSPLLTGIRTQSSSVFKQIEAGDQQSLQKTTKEKIRETQYAANTGTDTSANESGASASTQVSPLGEDNSGININNIDKSDENDEGFITKVQGNFFPATAPAGAYPNTPPGEGIAPGLPANIAGGIFNSECIPCGERLNMLGELNPAKFLDMGKLYIENWINWLTEQLNMLFDLIGLFTNTDNFIDLCALLKWLNDFVCVPDLQRILSVLMALMGRVSLESGGVLDIILGLIGPLLTPILSGFVDLLQSYILLIVRPIECIINSIQDIIRKLDYNVLFENIDTLDRHSSIGSDAPVSGSVKIPFLNTDIKYELPATGKTSTDLNLAGPIGSAIKRQNEEDQAVIETAAAELKAIRKAGQDIDAADAGAVERYNVDKAKAEEGYRRAIERRASTDFGRINATADRTVSNMKSALFSLVGMLREAASVVEGFFQDAFDELQKIMGAYIGGGNDFTAQLIKKMGLVQMISFISAVISAFANGIKCGDDKDDLKIEGFLPKEQGFKIWTDDQGSIHIQEDDGDFTEAVDAMVDAAGIAASNLIDTGQPSTTDPTSNDNRDGTGNKGSGPGTSDFAAVRRTKDKEKGQTANSSDSRQRLKSLIEFTGDPVLDTQIARVTEALVTQVNAVFRCPLQTDVAQAEQVNKWIRELNSE